VYCFPFYFFSCLAKKKILSEGFPCERVCVGGRGKRNIKSIKYSCRIQKKIEKKNGKSFYRECIFKESEMPSSTFSKNNL
jgi:hypothetical protein